MKNRESILIGVLAIPVLALLVWWFWPKPDPNITIHTWDTWSDAKWWPETVTSLKLTGEPMDEFPEVIGEMVNLRTLELGDCQFQEVPRVLENHKDLFSIRVRNSAFTRIPDAFLDASLLRTLEFYDTPIEELNPRIQSDLSLDRLTVKGGKLKEYPVFLARCPELSFVDLSRNQIEEVPSNMIGGYDLKTIDLSDNPLSVLPPIHPNAYSTSLEKLDLRNTEIRGYPTAYGEFYGMGEVLVGEK